MTPIHLDLLLHHYICRTSYKLLGVAIVPQPFYDDLLNSGLLVEKTEEERKESMKKGDSDYIYKITNKGKQLISAICALPYV
jgi:predicted transcriptional regulator